MAINANLVDVIREAIEARLLDVHVSMPGRVESYDGATQTIEVQPMIRRALPDTRGQIVHERLPKIANVPVMFPRAASFSLSFPLERGDFVMLLFNSSAIGQWRETGSLEDPVDLSRHSLSYPVAFPGIAPTGDTIATDPNAAIIETTNHVAIGSQGAEFVALSNRVDQFFSDLAIAINTAVPTPQDGGTALKSAILAALGNAGWSSNGPPQSTAASKLKSA